MNSYIRVKIIFEQREIKRFSLLLLEIITLNLVFVPLESLYWKKFLTLGVRIMMMIHIENPFNTVEQAQRLTPPPPYK